MFRMNRVSIESFARCVCRDESCIERAVKPHYVRPGDKAFDARNRTRQRAKRGNVFGPLLVGRFGFIFPTNNVSDHNFSLFGIGRQNFGKRLRQQFAVFVQVTLFDANAADRKP